MQQRRGNITISEENLTLADNLLRLELKLGARWFRRLDADWRELSEKSLIEIHHKFFSSLIGDSDIEVTDMQNLLTELEKVAPSKGRALAAHRTFALIKVIGYTQTKYSMRSSTFYEHCQYLRLAGLSSADLCAGKILELRKRSLVLQEPVFSWDEIRIAA